MKKSARIKLLLLLILTAATALGIYFRKQANTSINMLDLAIVYSYNGTEKRIALNPLVEMWTSDTDDGTSTSGTFMLLNPLELAAQQFYTSIPIDNTDVLLGLEFNYPPIEYELRKWPSEFLDRPEIIDNYEISELVEDSFIVRSVDIGTLFEVEARWQQGNVKYWFRIT
ncbi:MAG: hypothetical protein FWH33_08915 [Oscillospiraceae bacterium]|nr:hypothetical protein [Oscillospiraceae bacterium]